MGTLEQARMTRLTCQNVRTELISTIRGLAYETGQGVKTDELVLDNCVAASDWLLEDDQPLSSFVGKFVYEHEVECLTGVRAGLNLIIELLGRPSADEIVGHYGFITLVCACRYANVVLAEKGHILPDSWFDE